MCVPPMVVEARRRTKRPHKKVKKLCALEKNKIDSLEEHTQERVARENERLANSAVDLVSEVRLARARGRFISPPFIIM